MADLTPEAKAELLALADLIERASGPDRELDAAIGGAMHKRGWHAADCLGNFTASLDAAMTLVPEGWFLTLDRYILSDVPQRGSWRVWLKFVHPTDQVEKHFARCDTPALAVTAAALRTRASEVAP